jgi:hypothetical protein
VTSIVTDDADRAAERATELTPDQEDWVRAVLFSAADPGPMPADVAARLESALGTARLDPADLDPAHSDAADLHPATTVPTGTSTVTTLRARRSRRGRVLLAAAAVGGVLLVGGVTLSTVDGAGRETATSGAGGSPEQEAGPAEAMVAASGQTYTREGLAEDVRGLLATNPDLLERDAQGDAGAAGAEAHGEPSQDDAGEGAQGPSVLTESDDEAAPTITADIERLRNPQALAECTDELSAGGPAGVLAVDLAEFAGEPAAVVVLPGPTEARVDVYVVGPGCRSGSPDVRYFERVPVR